ncbi:MAG: SCO family protein [Deltaproteobacteria bacterium]|nr:SCO family protein [Deltaproteobacteria bacterium]
MTKKLFFLLMFAVGAQFTPLRGAALQRSSPLAGYAVAPTISGAMPQGGATSWNGAPASIYAGGWELTDQDGTKTPLDVFKGSPVIITMFYSSCPYSCPLLIESIKNKIEKKTSPSVRKNLRVLLITFDPTRDTPEKLKKLASEKSIDLTRWKLLTAKEDVVRDIAAVLQVKYRPLPGGDFSHSSIIALLNPDGVITARVDGLNQPFEPIVEKLVITGR